MDSNFTDPHAETDTTFEAVDIERIAPRIEAETLPQPAIGLGSSRFLSLTGFALVGGGVVLAVAPVFAGQISQVAKVAELATRFGVHAGALAVGGLVLMALGRIGKSVAKLAERPRMTDMGMADALERVGDQVATLTETLTKLGDRVTVLGLRESTVTVNAPAPDEDLVQLYRDQKDAVFQLAAGLDKLHRRVSDDLVSELCTLGARLDGFETSVFQELSTTANAAQEMFATTLKNEVANLTTNVQPIQQEEVDEMTPVEDVPSLAPQVDAFVTEHTEIETSPLEGAQLFTEEQPALPKSDLAQTTITEFADLSDVVATELSDFAENIHEEDTDAPQAAVQAPELEEPHPELEPEVSPLAFLEGLKSIEPISQNPHAPSVSAPPLDFDSLDEPPPALPSRRTPSRERPEVTDHSQFNDHLQG